MSDYYLTGGWTDGGVRTFAFAALQFADGTVVGEWQRLNQPVPSHGDVVCLNIIGTQARIGTTIATGPFAGSEGGFTAIDNGEGANAAPDQFTLQFVNLGPGGAAAYCAGALGDPTLAPGVGNIRIS